MSADNLVAVTANRKKFSDFDGVRSGSRQPRPPVDCPRGKRLLGCIGAARHRESGKGF